MTYCTTRESCQGPLLVTCAYFGMYYLFCITQSLSKLFLYHFTNAAVTKDGKKESYGKFKYGPSKGLLFATFDRTFGNTLEQSIPFLISLWLHAWYVSAESATSYGWWYIAFRAIYPALFYAGIPWLFISTVPGYAIIFKLLVDLVV